MAEIRYYVDVDGRAPFIDWAEELDVFASAKVARALRRMILGVGQIAHRHVGEGVLEFRIDFGPGYRIYFGARWRRTRGPAHRRNEETLAAGHSGRALFGATTNEPDARSSEWR